MKQAKFKTLIQQAQEDQKGKYGFWGAIGRLQFKLADQKLTINAKQFNAITYAIIYEDFNKIVFTEDQENQWEE